MTHNHPWWAVLVLAATGLSQSSTGSLASVDRLPKLHKPFLVEADGKPIATRTGHAAPAFADLDDDGRWDLAVGEFGGGGCRIYKNIGTAKEPRFGAFEMLQSDGKPAAMESS